MFLGNIVDQFHNKHGFADACAAKQTDFAALGVRADKVDDLYAGFKHLGRCGKICIIGSRTMDVPSFAAFRIGLIIDCVAQHIKDPAERAFADGHTDTGLGIPRCKPSVELMAMQRTVLSPICCATSTVSVLLPFGIVSALLMPGS